ncbi:MAG: anhydro-N-acetylmuramic acid kinase [Bacteroidia bacterium]|nr:anhydro-N-acetylmuramic acid kinase [Bacteroidia bacterium]MCX7652685.1 anhydro-N-acetylmuramic acid kinase [Bacteroidia bacterium]MDW8416431.1 anhydro-N-acetylmuramic acid kinase [Bacteroidia bacterium]
MSLSSFGSWRVLSLMAGSSADGVTAILVSYRRGASGWVYTLLEAETFAYPQNMRFLLRQSASASGKELLRLSVQYTDWTAQTVNRHFAQFAYELIVWHGHTVFHEPEKGLTWGLGDTERLRVLSGKPVVAHMRARDVASGGTGAPLIPNADLLLFSEYETLINLGGIANITHLPSRSGYDISPCNQLLDALATQANPDCSYDPEGRLAREGIFIPELIEQFERHAFFRAPSPKALDNETVQRDFVAPFLRHSAPPKDKLHTAVIAIVRQIVKALVGTSARTYTCTGGGAKNAFLMEHLRTAADKIGVSYVEAPSALVDYREAIGFGLLGLLRFLGLDNTAGEWTGASRHHSSGSLSL